MWRRVINPGARRRLCLLTSTYLPLRTHLYSPLLSYLYSPPLTYLYSLLPRLTSTLPLLTRLAALAAAQLPPRWHGGAQPTVAELPRRAAASAQDGRAGGAGGGARRAAPGG